MTVKMTGAQFKRYHTDKDPQTWPGEDNGDTFYDEVVFYVDGVEQIDDIDHSSLSDSAIVAIQGGVIISTDSRIDGISVEAHARRWMKRQNTVVVMVECSKDQLEAVEAAVKGAGGKVVRS